MSEAGDSLSEHFGGLTDPRYSWGVDHNLEDIVTIAVCGTIWGADDWVGIAEFGRAKEAWLRTFLALPNGIPSDDPLRRIFAPLDPEAFQSCFLSWGQGISQKISGETVATLGKRRRRSHEGRLGQAAIPRVSAWACENRLGLGQVKTDEKSNEITAIPELLRVLALEGCLVTIAAMGCQTEMARLIVEQAADDGLSLQGHQGTLHQDVQDMFAYGFETDFADLDDDFHQDFTTGHGRLEIRRTWTISDPQLLAYLNPKGPWTHLQSMGLVEAERHLDGTVTPERRFFLSSLPGQAAQFARAVRAHWPIENRLHWVLDIAFQEDQARIRKGYGPQNRAILRHLALNLLHRDQTTPCGIMTKRLIAAWNHDFLLHLLNLS